LARAAIVNWVDLGPLEVSNVADLSTPGPRALAERSTVVFPRSDKSGEEVTMVLKRFADDVPRGCISSPTR
jgi:hypothetical protein